MFLFSGSLLQVPDRKIDSVRERSSSEPEHELMNDSTKLPDEITKHAKDLIKYVKVQKAVTQKTVCNVELWDFAGQGLYYASHSVFLTSRAIYILVCDLSESLHHIALPFVRHGNDNFTLDNPNGETNLENLLSWLSTVHSITQTRGETCADAGGRLRYLRPPVIIVGTHADKPFEDIATMESKIKEGIAGRGYEGHVVWPMLSIDNTATIDGIPKLKHRIMEVLRLEPYMREIIPAR